VIKTFEVQLGIRFVGDLLRIVNNIQGELDEGDEGFIENQILLGKKMTLKERLSESIAKQVKGRLEEAEKEIAKEKA